MNNNDQKFHLVKKREEIDYEIERIYDRDSLLRRYLELNVVAVGLFIYFCTVSCAGFILAGAEKKLRGGRRKIGGRGRKG